MKKTIYLLVLLLVLGGCSSNNETKELVVSSWGLSEDILRTEVYKPFEEANNVKIVLDSGSTSERYSKFSSGDNSNIDVIELSQKAADDGYQADLFEKLDPSKLSNFDALIDAAQEVTRRGYGVPYTINSIGIVYNEETVSEPINTWADLWRSDLQDKVAIPEISSTFGPSMVQMANDYVGGDLANDQGEAAFMGLETLKPNIKKTYKKSSDLSVMMSTGEIDVAVVGDFGFDVIKKSVPSAKLVFPTTGTYANFNTIEINKNSKNKDLAYKFVDWRLSQELQEKTAGALNEAPVNKNVVLTDDVAQNKTYGIIAEHAKTLNYEIINPLMPQWIDRYNRLMNQ